MTRLHGDTYFTHAWLSQISGSKQFVLYPPSQHHLLHATATANAGADCAFDPLAPDYGRFPRARGATPHVAVCGPGDTILVRTLTLNHPGANPNPNHSGANPNPNHPGAARLVPPC